MLREKSRSGEARSGGPRPSMEMKRETIVDPDLNRKATNYRDNHKHRYAAEIILHFINVKY